jgi:hypothetical protein
MTYFRSSRVVPIACGLLCLASLPAFIACSSTEPTGPNGAKVPASSVRVETITHEACDESGNRVDVLDSNNDGKTDIKRMYDKKSGVEVCRIVDLNHDGKPDLFEYFDASGVVRRREYAYDDSGSVNAIEYYEGGKLARREYDTTGQHRIDTWDFFDTSKPPSPKTGRPVPVRRERDTNGNGVVDQWWVWDGDKITISVDKTGDGKPDPENTIILNNDDGGVPSAVAPTDNGFGSSPASGGDDAGAAPTPTPSAVTPTASDAGAAPAKDGGKP